MLAIRTTLRAAVVLTLISVLSACTLLPPQLAATPWDPVMALDITRDGRYAISSHKNNALYLWDLEERHAKKIADDANIYSARFVQNRDLILWQDTNDRVFVQKLDGETVEAFEHFPTYGHAMSEDLSMYLSANETWNLFSAHGDAMEPVLRDSDSPSFIGSGKLLNIALADEEYFLTVGRGMSGADERPIDEEHPPVRDQDDLAFTSFYAGPVLWSQKTLKPVAKFSGNSYKTHAIISPDGQWVVSADEGKKAFYWKTEKPAERNRLAAIGIGLYKNDPSLGPDNEDNWDTSRLIDAPSGTTDTTIALAFIHKSKYYLRFGNYSHQAALFKTGSPWPQKYFDLGEEPYLVTYGSQYSRNTAIASSPEAGVLVMGHAESGGISVYQFDEEELTLERVWVDY